MPCLFPGKYEFGNLAGKPVIFAALNLGFEIMLLLAPFRRRDYLADAVGRTDPCGAFGLRVCLPRAVGRVEVQSGARAIPTSGWLRPEIVKRLLKPIARLLQTGDPGATVNRLFRSQHVEDLRLIIAVALIGVLLALVIGVPLSLENVVVDSWSNIATRRTDWIFLRLGFAAARTFLSFFAPVLAVFGAVLAWAYQVGSARLGVVDLFACEISTLCRVATVVDTVRRYVDMFDEGPPVWPADTGGPHGLAHQFTSQENYFPVFESNTRDLQTLEARVVINITAFYTYMKVVRDSLRTLAEIRPQPAEWGSPSNKVPAAGPWHEAVRNIVYMLFLGLESARHAIADLVEFEPEEAERTMVILINELEAYRFLCSQFTDEQDIRHQRIMLRASEYQYVVPKLRCSLEAARTLEKTIEAGTESFEHRQVSRWEPAWRLLPELQRRYQAAMGPINL